MERPRGNATTSRSAKSILLATKNDVGLQNSDGENGCRMSFVDGNEYNFNIQSEMEQIKENRPKYSSTQKTNNVYNENEEARPPGHGVLLSSQHLHSQNIEDARRTEIVLCTPPILQSYNISTEVEAISTPENILLTSQHLQLQNIEEVRSTEIMLCSSPQLQSNVTNTEDEAIPVPENVLLSSQQLQCDKKSASSSTSNDEDFGSSSSDDFVLGTDETTDTSSCSSVPEKKKKKNTIPNKTKITTPKITIPESENSTESETILQDEAGCSFWINNGMTDQGKKRKPRKSEKERRDDRKKRQYSRNKGLEYITNKGKTKKARVMQELSMCRQNCKGRLEPDLRKKLFKEYWSLGDSVKRTIYMEKCIESRKKRSSKSSPIKQRTFSNHYYVQDGNLKKIKICKGCLLRTFDETNRFIQSVCENKQKYGQIQARKRQRKLNRAIPENKLEEIKSHINSFPCSDSHYGRSKTTKKFLNSELTLQKMYDLYKDKIENPVSKTIYSKVFKGLNLSFKKPSLDTCSKCDGIKMKLKYITGEEADLLEEELKDHQAAFRSAYDQKRDDKKRAQDNEDIAAICFDLQQCLPTPFLNTNVAFYKRQLWTYNLTIHDLKTNKAFCYMWPECIGGRGANDIASCLYDFIVNQLPLLHPRAKHLIMYSDSCPGQNKNSIVTTMLMMATKCSTQLETIEHKFLVPGHTHMEADSDHALIERKKKRTCMDIHLPRDWYQLVRTASNRATKFTVIEMEQQMFYDFNNFAKQYLMLKKNNQNNKKFIWAKIRHFKYTKHDFPRFFYKEEFGCVGDFLCMDYGKRGKNYDLITINLVNKNYLSGIPISTEKKKDLCQLLPFIHESAHEFYRSLSCKADVIDTAVYSDSDDET